MVKYKRNPTVLFVQQDGEIALYHPGTNKYFGLEELGGFVWDFIEIPRTFTDIFDEVEKSYEVVNAVLEQDLNNFMLDLVKENVVELED